MWMCQRGGSFCHTLSTTPVLRLWSVWSDLFACGLTFSERTGHEEVGRMRLGTRLSFLAERANKTGRQHLVSQLQLRSHRWGDPRWGSRRTSWRTPLFRGPPPADGSRSCRLWWPPRPPNASFLPPTCHSPVKKNKATFKLDWKSPKTLRCSCFVSPRRAQDLFYNIITLSEARGSRAGNPVDPRHTQTHAHSPASNIPTNLRSLTLT